LREALALRRHARVTPLARARLIQSESGRILETGAQHAER
jgi:hypothetical protein